MEELHIVSDGVTREQQAWGDTNGAGLLTDAGVDVLVVGFADLHAAMV